MIWDNLSKLKRMPTIEDVIDEVVDREGWTKGVMVMPDWTGCTDDTTCVRCKVEPGYHWPGEFIHYHICRGCFRVITNHKAFPKGAPQ